MSLIKKPYISIRFKIVTLFSLLILVLIIIVNLIFYKGIDSTIRKSTEKEYRIITDETANKIERFLFERYGDIQVLANNSILHNQNISHHDKVRFLDRVREAYHTYDFILVLDKNGKILLKSGKAPKNLNTQDLFLETKLHKVFVSDINKLNNEFGIYFCASIYDAKGNFFGAAIERMNFNSIREIKEKVKIAKNGFAFLMNEHHQHLFIQDISDQFIIPHNSESGIKYVNFKGNEFIYVYKQLKRYATQEQNWYLVLKCYEKEAFTILYQIWYYTLSVILISILAIVILAYLVAYYITKPFNRLVQETQLLANGEQMMLSETERKDEIGVLATSLNTILLNLNTMTEQILETSGQAVHIKEIKEYFNKLTDEVSTGIMTLNAKGMIISANHAAFELLGLNSDQLIGKNIADTDSAELQPLCRLIKNCLVEGKECVRDIIQIGTESINKTLLFSNTIQKDKNGRMLGLVAIFRKMDDFIRFEESVTRAKTLNALGLMSAGIAHEIRNPLTSIKGYTQYIQKNLPKEHELQKDIDIILYEVNRLNNLINRFLEFARPQKPQLKITNLKQLIVNTIMLLQRDFNPNVQFYTEFDTQTDLMVDEDQIEQVLINLIVNAIQSILTEGIISIKTKISADYFVIDIEDNGNGVEKKLAEHLFEPFFTTKEKGTGLGLAICARIIQEHNGLIEYHPADIKGSVFVIKLPLKESDRSNNE